MSRETKYKFNKSLIMNSILSNNLFLVKEHVGMFKASNNFDIYNPNNSEMIMTCRENKLGFFTKLFRFTKFKLMTPFHVEIKDMSGQQVLTMKRSASFLGFAPIIIIDEKGMPIGQLVRRFRLGGAKIEINDMTNQNLCTLEGNFIGWNFKITKKNIEIAAISKKWAGIGKELFTSADNYILQIYDTVEKEDTNRLLILSSVLCVDFLLHEKP